MTHHEQVNNWIETVSSHLNNLSKPQARMLALWSFAAVIVQSASLTLNSLLLAGLLDQKVNTLRQRLKEFYKESPAKKGAKRRHIEVKDCFAPLMSWVLQLWPSTQLTLALDPTLCRDRFACLCVSLVYEGGSIPVAWKILPANTTGAWVPHWHSLLNALRAAIPPGTQVIVLSDRGLFSRMVFAQICALGFHPMMRVNKLGTWQPLGDPHWYYFQRILTRPGHYYCAQGQAFKTKNRQLSCTLIVVWQQGYDEPWYLVSNLDPEQCEGAWYGLRCWIEHGFRCIKSFGMHWERSRITDSERLERLWLVYALALLWTQAIAGAIEANAVPLFGLGLSMHDLQDTRSPRISRFRLGFVVLLLAMLKQSDLPMPKTLNPGIQPKALDCQPIQLCKEHST